MTYKPVGDIITRHNRDSQYTVDGFADTSTIHLDTGSVAATSGFMLVDISDIINWKHTEIDHVIIRHILIEIDPDAAFLGEIKVGYLTNVDANNGDLNNIIDM